jgi:hypothetical protein
VQRSRAAFLKKAWSAKERRSGLASRHTPLLVADPASGMPSASVRTRFRSSSPLTAYVHLSSR